MGLWRIANDQTEGQRAIRSKLREARMLLDARRSDLEKNRRAVLDLEEACVRLATRIEALERDEAALSRQFASVK